jgi:hypothetical protein
MARVKLPAVWARGIGTGLPPERVEAPGEAGEEHEGGALRGGGGQAGQNKVGEPAEGDPEPQPLARGGPAAAPDAAQDHGELNGGEQQERSGPCGQLPVGEREGDRVEGQERRRGPPRGGGLRPAGPHPDQGQEHRSAGGEANRREGSRVDAPGREGQAAEQGVGRKGDEGEDSV